MEKLGAQLKISDERQPKDQRFAPGIQSWLMNAMMGYISNPYLRLLTTLYQFEQLKKSPVCQLTLLKPSGSSCPVAQASTKRMIGCIPTR